MKKSVPKRIQTFSRWIYIDQLNPQESFNITLLLFLLTHHFCRADHWLVPTFKPPSAGNELFIYNSRTAVMKAKYSY